MLNSGKKISALRDKKNKYSNSCVVRKKILNETKNHKPPPPFQVKWSVPNVDIKKNSGKNTSIDFDFCNISSSCDVVYKGR
jgi:hypothetical protein